MTVCVEKALSCRWILTTGAGSGDSLLTVDSLLIRDTHKALDHRHKAFSLVTVDISNLNATVNDLACETNRHAVHAARL